MENKKKCPECEGEGCIASYSYEGDKGWDACYHCSGTGYISKKTKIVCAVCGEETAGNPTYSFHGSAHKWGPTDHTFEPKIVEEEE